MPETLFEREVYKEVQKYLGTDNIIVLHGARQVGKTHILYFIDQFLQKRGDSTFYFDLEDGRLLGVLNLGVDSFLSYLREEGINLEEIKAGSKKLFVFIDEVQYLQTPSSFLKLLADHHKYIQLIVSGSSSFNIKSKFSDSLVGRTVNFEVYPLSFKEFLLFKKISAHPADLEKLYEEYVNYGGYPKIVLEPSVERKEKYLQQIVETYVKKDISDLAKINDTKKFNDLLKVLASQSGQLLNVNQLSNICNLAVQTINNYLSILENTYIIKLVLPFSGSSKVEVTKTPKIFFFDTGLMQMLWLNKLKNGQIGSIFETSVFSELVKKYGVQKINFWRNKNTNEIDFVLQKKEGLLPIEVKSNFGQFKKRQITLFMGKYHLSKYAVVGLWGKKTSPNYFYPWEI